MDSTIISAIILGAATIYGNYLLRPKNQEAVARLQVDPERNGNGYSSSYILNVVFNTMLIVILVLWFFFVLLINSDNIDKIDHSSLFFVISNIIVVISMAWLNSDHRIELGLVVGRLTLLQAVILLGTLLPYRSNLDVGSIIQYALFACGVGVVLLCIINGIRSLFRK